MLQIIGWLLCLYLVVKACELLSMEAEKHPFARPIATAGAVIALIGAGVFFYLINEQVRQSNAAQEQMQSSLGDMMR